MAAREPQIRSWNTRAVLQELDARAIPAEKLLARHGFTRAELEDPEGWVPLRRHNAFFGAAVEASGDPTFGFAVGDRIPYQATGVVGHCAALSRDVREAWETWSRFSDLVVDDTEYGLRSTPEFDAIFFRRPPALLPLPLDGMSFAACVVAGLREMIGPLSPVELLLTGPAPRSSRAVLERAFGAPIRYGAERVELRLPPGTFDRPIRFASPGTRAIFMAAAERELAKRRGRRTADRVRAAVLTLGLDRRPTVQEVAGALGTTDRTLQRWLADESLTFSAILGDTIHEAAVDMLRDQGLPVAEVFHRLGFSSHSAFRRAVRRWTGKTPEELQRPGRAQR
jgi:AraC-like DNA-binding protein